LSDVGINNLTEIGAEYLSKGKMHQLDEIYLGKKIIIEAGIN
jgi:hypothetical protein